MFKVNVFYLNLYIHISELSVAPFYVTKSSPSTGWLNPTNYQTQLKFKNLDPTHATQPNPVERRSRNWRGQRNKTCFIWIVIGSVNVVFNLMTFDLLHSVWYVYAVF